MFEGMILSDVRDELRRLNSRMDIQNKILAQIASKLDPQQTAMDIVKAAEPSDEDRAIELADQATAPYSQEDGSTPTKIISMDGEKYNYHTYFASKKGRAVAIVSSYVRTPRQEGDLYRVAITVEPSVITFERRNVLIDDLTQEQARLMHDAIVRRILQRGLPYVP